MMMRTHFLRMSRKRIVLAKTWIRKSHQCSQVQSYSKYSDIRRIFRIISWPYIYIVTFNKKQVTFFNNCTLTISTVGKPNYSSCATKGMVNTESSVLMNVISVMSVESFPYRRQRMVP